ncbi:serine proteinase stubble-like [Drosophila willistoni]|uniref:serine proteinase stubble-like n=1 Tax=Drosophila willistoni TaxID=7260 RepID=UPI00017D977F|nr:serine proteinase stubble-like [Drosophila willistoni]
MAFGINIRIFLLLVMVVHSTWSQVGDNSLRLHIPVWDITDLYSRLSSALHHPPENPTTSPPEQQFDAAVLANYYNNFWQSVENKKQQLGLWSDSNAGEVIPVEPVPLPLPPLPLQPLPPYRPQRPLRPLRPNRPRPRPTRRPTRRPTTTRRTTTTTAAATTTTSTTVKPTTITTTTTKATTTSTTAASSTTESTSTESTSTNSSVVSTTTGSSTTGSSTTGSSTTGSSTTGSSTSGYSTTGTIIVSSRTTQSPYSTEATTVNPICNLFPHLPICTSSSSSSRLHFQEHNSTTIPTVLSQVDTFTSQLHPEQQLSLQSSPYPMTSLCYNYPRLCAHPEEAQYVRLSDGHGRPMLLIVPDRMSYNKYNMPETTTPRTTANNNYNNNRPNNMRLRPYRPTPRPAWQRPQRKHNYLKKMPKWKL